MQTIQHARLRATTLPWAGLTRGLFLLVAAASTWLTTDQAATAATAEPDRSRLVSELQWEGKTVDTSPTPNACTVHGNVAYAEGKQGRCAAFDGRTWIDTGVSQTSLGDQFTVECWVNPAPQQHQHADIFGNHSSDAAGFVLQQDGANTNEFQAAYGAGSGRWVLTDPIPLVAGQWQHVALVKNATELQFYLNGVLVTSRRDAAPAAVSLLNVAVGLGYAAPERCFQGLVDSLRIWNTPLTDFSHAGIDPVLARTTAARHLGVGERSAPASTVKSWSLATDDTHMSLGVTAADQLVVSELSCPAVGHNWIRQPMACTLWADAEVNGRCVALDWRLAEATVDSDDGQRLTLRFLCSDPALECTAVWHAGQGPGPIQLSTSVTNRTDHVIKLGDQPTLDLEGASVMWSFHSDGGTPDAVGVYREPLDTENAPVRRTVRTAPLGEFIPYVVLDSGGSHGVYLGLEWSYCRIETLLLAQGPPATMRVRAGDVAGRRLELPAGGTLVGRPGFVGAYSGDVDQAGNRLRKWLFRYCLPEILRQDAGYPKVQWNAFGATGKSPGSWDPVESKYYPLIDDIAPLGFEEVMIDVAWWQGDEPDADQVDWPSGMRRAAEYTHQHGMRFGLYWTDHQDMATAEGRDRRAGRITRLFQEYQADLWRSDSTRGEVILPSYASTLGFYRMVDTLAAEIPGFQWENCSGGGRIKDFGAMRRAVKIFNSDTYSALHVRQAFYDSSFVLHPIQIEGHLGSTDGRYRPQGASGIRYAFRSTSMGAPEWFLDAPNGGNGSESWTAEEKETLKECVALYKSRLRPLVRSADLYHIFPRPDGRSPDGIEYYDPESGKGVVYVFQPDADVPGGNVQLKGLNRARQYALEFQDGSHPDTVLRGDQLMDDGLEVTLSGDEASELVFFELCEKPDRQGQ